MFDSSIRLCITEAVFSHTATPAAALEFALTGGVNSVVDSAASQFLHESTSFESRSEIDAATKT